MTSAQIAAQYRQRIDAAKAVGNYAHAATLLEEVIVLVQQENQQLMAGLAALEEAESSTGAKMDLIHTVRKAMADHASGSPSSTVVSRHR